LVQRNDPNVRVRRLRGRDVESEPAIARPIERFLVERVVVHLPLGRTRRPNLVEIGKAGSPGSEKDSPTVGRPNRSVVRTVRCRPPGGRATSQIQKPQVPVPPVRVHSLEGDPFLVRRKLEPAVTRWLPDVALTFTRAVKPGELRIRIGAAIEKNPRLRDRE